MKKILFISIALLLNSATWAAQSKPEKCPSVDAIQASGFDASAKEESGYYTVCKTSNYDTHDKWTFLIYHIKASSRDEATEKATLALQTLSGNPEPTYINGHFGCHYDTKSDYYANAYNAQPTICKH